MPRAGTRSPVLHNGKSLSASKFDSNSPEKRISSMNNFVANQNFESPTKASLNPPPAILENQNHDNQPLQSSSSTADHDESGNGGSSSSSSAAVMPQTNSSGRPSNKEEEGSGWVQWTDRGKMYLSRQEKNVFVLEGTTAAGFAACAYNGGREDKKLIRSGEWSLVVEIKNQTVENGGGELYIMIDSIEACDLSSGCDFLGVKLSFSTRELKVENRRKTNVSTLFAIPNLVMLRNGTYINLKLDFCGDLICNLSLNGVSLVQNLSMGRLTDRSRFHSVGIATYGRSKAFLKRFKIEPFSPTTKQSSTSDAVMNNIEQTSGQIVQQLQVGGQRNSGSTPYGLMTPDGKPVNSLGNGGIQAISATVNSYASAAMGNNPTCQNLGNQNIGNNANSNIPSSITEELDLCALIERDVLLNTSVSNGDASGVKFEEIGGLDAAKSAINEAVVLPLLVPEFFTGIRRPWSGVLLYGPPGTGKTLLARAVAATATESVTFFNCSCATLTSKWRGESEKLLRALFSMARQRHPSILFFDEVDSLLSSRGGNEHEASRRFKSEFLIHMDGLLSDEKSPLVLCTSNSPWDLDDALKRRLEKRIYIPLPDEAAREQMIRQNVQNIDVDPDFDPAHLATICKGYSGADLKSVCREASMAPLRRGLVGLTAQEIRMRRNEGKILKPEPVLQQDFLSALINVAPSVDEKIVEKYEKWTQEFGSR